MAHYRDLAAAAALLLPSVLWPAMLLAADRTIDAARSVLAVHVGKAGLFAAAGHEHWVDAPIARGEFSTGDGAHVSFDVDARKMTVRPDEKTSAVDRAKIQDTMQRSVLESGKFPEIRFRSTNISASGGQTWKVVGTLTLHGVSKPVAVEVRRDGDTYAGSTRIRQTAFGIQPVSIAGGAIKVKDELNIEFKIRAAEK